MWWYMMFSYVVTHSRAQGPLTKVCLSPYAERGLVQPVKSKMGQKDLFKAHEGFASLH